MSNDPKAVFLSYASQDAGAAKRICEALEAGGVEVWFDQSELVGGDAWDQKIRGQIKTCALFVPIISANTQARREGYFRREWKQAAERTRDMADGTPFLLPVVIDATSDAEALVPEEFRSVQWTRLVGGEATPAFVARVKRLIEGEGRDASLPRQARDTELVERARRPGLDFPANHGRLGERSLRWRRRTRTAAVVGGIVLAGIVVAIWQPWQRAVSTAPNTAPETKTAAAMASAMEKPALTNDKSAPADKSIAVLPFTNMSDDKGSGFFADGVHEDILTSLYLIPDLKVTSRQSVAQYRDTKKSMRVIGQELGVTYILAGSVRRDGTTVRVTGQLIRAATDEHLWAKRFDKEFKDLFVIQSELAQAIADELQTRLSPEAKKILEGRPTKNAAAYDLYLKAREIGDTDKRRENLLQAAVVLDPNFALAWGDLAWVHGWIYFTDYDHSSLRLGKAKAAIDTAIRLAPDAPGIILNLGYYYYYGHRDYVRATEQFEKVARLQPNAPAPRYALALIQKRQGKWTEALDGFRKVAQIDPAHASASSQIAYAAIAGRRWDLAVAARRRFYGLRPNPLVEARTLANYAFLARGSTREMEDVLAGLPNGEANSTNGFGVRMDLALMRGDCAEVVRIDRLRPPVEGNVGTELEWALPVATALAAQGDLAGARVRLEKFPSKLRARIELEPENAWLWSLLGAVEALLGNKNEALGSARKAVELVPESVDANDGPYCRCNLAFVHAWIGDKESALAEYARLLGVPLAFAEVNVHKMKHHPAYHPLHGDPRFEALLNDP